MLRTPLLVGEWELTVDDKSRLSIPADIRRLLDPERDGDYFYLVFGVNRKPWLYTQKAYEHLAEQVPVDIAPGEEMMIYDQLTFALANRVEMDKQGRISIPEKMLRRTGLQKEVTLFGARDHLQIWNRADFEESITTNQERIADVSYRAKQSRQSMMSPRPT